MVSVSPQILRMELLALRDRFNGVTDELLELCCWLGKEAFNGIGLLLEALGELCGCLLTENVGVDLEQLVSQKSGNSLLWIPRIRSKYDEFLGVTRD